MIEMGEILISVRTGKIYLVTESFMGFFKEILQANSGQQLTIKNILKDATLPVKEPGDPPVIDHDE